MKSEHRHELQTNDLGQYAEKAAAYIDKNGNRLMMIICVVAIVASGGIFWWRTASSKTTAAWTDLSMALSTGNPDNFRSVWEDHKGSVPAYWAKVREGEALLGQGVQASFRNLEKATVDLKKSRDAFQLIVDDRGAPAEIRERALFGLGRATESLSEGNNNDAVKAYEQLVKEFPKSEYKDDAQSRIEILNSGRGQEFYAWFAKYTRPKVAEKRPNDLGVGGLKGEDGSESGAKKRLNADDDKEDLTMPEERGDKPAESAADDNGEKTPAADADKKPETPAEDKPAEPEAKTESQPKTEEPQ